MAIDSARIAKNTSFLFIRFLFILGVTFYISRVLLDKLGVEDFGLYNTVYGITVTITNNVVNIKATGAPFFFRLDIVSGKECASTVTEVS